MSVILPQGDVILSYTQKTTADIFDFSAITEDDVKNCFGKGAFESALSKFSFSEIKDNGNEFVVNDASVIFTLGSGLEGVICSCKSKNCVHKAIACIYKLIQNKKIVSDDLFSQLALTDENLTTLLNLKEYLSRIPSQGVYTLAESDCETLMFYSLNLKGMSDRLSKNLSSFSTMVRDCYENQVYFDSSYSAKLFFKIFNTVSAAISKCNDPKALNKILGEGERVYLKVQKGSFIGLGSCPFETASGYLCVSTYLYWVERKSIVTFTRVLPTIYEENVDILSWVENLYQSSVGESAVSCKILGQGAFTIYNFKISGDLRITFSQETLLLKLDAYINTIPTNSYDEILKIKEQSRDYFETAVPEYYVAEVDEIIFNAFNSSSGSYEFSIIKNKKALDLSVHFSLVTDTAIAALEKGFFFDKLVLKKIGGSYAPISAVLDNKVIDFYFRG